MAEELLVSTGTRSPKDETILQSYSAMTLTLLVHVTLIL